MASRGQLSDTGPSLNLAREHSAAEWPHGAVKRWLQGERVTLLMVRDQAARGLTSLSIRRRKVRSATSNS
jgi:hypothetical protein